jgi:hypothetical protein
LEKKQLKEKNEGKNRKKQGEKRRKKEKEENLLYDMLAVKLERVGHGLPRQVFLQLQHASGLGFRV